MRKNRLLFSFILLSTLLSWFAGAAAAQGQVYQVYTHHDNQSPVWVFKMLIPQGWQTSGGITWLPHPKKISQFQFSVSAPDGSAGLDYYPDYLNVFSYDRSVTGWYGQHMPVMQPMSAVDFLQQVVVPNFRGQMQNLRVLEAKQLPGVAQQVNAAVQRQAQADPVYAQLIMGSSVQYDVARCDISYSYNGRQFFETFLVLVVYTQTANGAITFWGPESISSFWCDFNRKHELINQYVTMKSSFQVNPAFQRMLYQVNLLMVQNNRAEIQSIGELSDYIRNTNNEINQMIRSSYEYKDAVFDRSHEKWSEYIRDVNTAVDNEIRLEVPNGWDYVWRSGDKVIVSNDPGYNPNQHRPENWGQMQLER